MICPDGAGHTLGQFALVSYIPDPLASFLDHLRLELLPNCSPHAHVTVLPPRPFAGELKETIHRLAEACRMIPPFDIELGRIEVFPISDVVYLTIGQGHNELLRRHRQLNCGALEYQENFQYHPHITIAQNIPQGQVREIADRAAERWAHYGGPRNFRVESLSFVQHFAPGKWVDIAELPLAVEAPVAG